jgi:hypothetical protein
MFIIVPSFVLRLKLFEALSGAEAGCSSVPSDALTLLPLPTGAFLVFIFFFEMMIFFLPPGNCSQQNESMINSKQYHMLNNRTRGMK